MKKVQDAYGQQLLVQYNTKRTTVEILEREDGYIAPGSDPGLYFREYKQWSSLERRAISYARGRILDVGCGAGRHTLYLQNKDLEVTAIDISPGAVKVCKLRGVKKALVRSVDQIDKFKPNSFDTILMFGNNFGLFRGASGIKSILRKMHKITSSDARIIAGARNPYMTQDPNHLAYHRWNKTAWQNGRASKNAREI